MLKNIKIMYINSRMDYKYFIVSLVLVLNVSFVCYKKINKNKKLEKKI